MTSELFGHRKGSFTGAGHDRRGLFQTAHTGTIFLDEIGDCPPDLQTRLLRVLDRGEIRRVGDDVPTTVDVRIVAATNRDLEKEVEEGRFRRDLFFRLSVITVELPPLRERREDIPELAQRFLQRGMEATGKRLLGFAPATLRLLREHDYPGNIRELENEVERALTLAEPGGYVTPDLLSPKFNALESPDDSPTSLRAAVRRFEASFLAEALQRNGGNQSQTAVEIQISRSSLVERMRRYGIR